MSWKSRRELQRTFWDFQANTTTLFYRKLRVIIAEKLEHEASELAGEIKLDESYFGGVRKGKHGRGAAGKVPVFGLLKRGGKVYTQIIDNTRTDRLMPIIRRKIEPDRIVYTDSYRSYNALDTSEFKNYRINHSTVFAEGRNHINGIEISGIKPNVSCANITAFRPSNSIGS